MRPRFTLATLASWSLLLASTSALAEATLGELLEAGARRLEKAEVEALLVGATLSGPTDSGGDVRLEVRADHSLSGTLRVTIRSIGVTGSWKLEDDGRFCTDLGSSGPRPIQVTACNHYYLRGKDVFVADAAATATTTVRPRTISR